MRKIIDLTDEQSSLWNKEGVYMLHYGFYYRYGVWESYVPFNQLEEALNLFCERLELTDWDRTQSYIPEEFVIYRIEEGKHTLCMSNKDLITWYVDRMYPTESIDIDDIAAKDPMPLAEYQEYLKYCKFRDYSFDD